jgi:hypothetical protein
VSHVIHRAEEVERVHEAMLHHQKGQNQAAQEWLTQQCSWEETMQRLQELDQEMDETWLEYTRMLQEATNQSDQERHYKLIFYYVTTVLSERPEKLPAVLYRLEKDSQRLPPDSPKRGTAARDGTRR